MASVRKNKKARAVRRNSNFKIRVGKIKGYKDAVRSKLADARQFRALVQSTLTKYATFLDSVDVNDLGDEGKKLIECCDQIYSDAIKFDTDIATFKKDADEFLSKKSLTAFEMHGESLDIVTNLNELVMQHTQLFAISIEQLNTIKFDN